MKNIQLRTILVAVFLFIGGFAVQTTTVDAITSTGNSNASVEFFGKPSDNKNNDNDSYSSSGENSVDNSRLPQTGDFVLPNTSLYGYTMLIVAISWLLLSKKKRD